MMCPKHDSENFEFRGFYICVGCKNPIKRIWRNIYHKIDIWWFIRTGGFKKPHKFQGQMEGETAKQYCKRWRITKKEYLQSITNNTQENVERESR